jgi:Family of unknown function (DUF6604)
LTNTARKCGCIQSVLSEPASTKSTDGAPQASTRLKGNARKEAKADEASSNAPALPTNKHIIPTREIIIQVNLIAGFKKPAVKVPLVIQGVLRRAIRARKRCTLWFQQTATNGNKEKYESSDSAHEHFINVLERALEILEPRFEKSKPATADTKDEGHRDVTSSITNRFEKLEVEDTTNQGT